VKKKAVMERLESILEREEGKRKGNNFWTREEGGEDRIMIVTRFVNPLSFKDSGRSANNIVIIN
jgi:hypothetical protein